MNFTQSQYDVIVLGAGAAGLLCAITAAQRGRRVLVLEKANKVGKKILMSGGGRCNFTNYVIDASNYISNNEHFSKSALNRYTQWDFIAMVEKHGIDYEERKHGQLFCVNSAKDILKMLLDECEQYGVEIRTHCEVRELETQLKSASETKSDSAHHYTINVTIDQVSRKLTSHSVVVATGALSIPTLGGSGLGYAIGEQLGLGLIPRRAGLVPLMFSDQMKAVCERLSGLSLEANISCKGQHFAENILFTHRGISGPAVLQISNYWKPGDEVHIDLLPSLDAKEWLLNEKYQQGNKRLKTVLSQHLPKALVEELQALWWPSLGDTALAEFPDKQLESIAGQLNDWALKPSATEGYRTAEVTLGGIDTNDLSSKTMEAKTQSGLFFVGEVVDVTGHLGGFNFQWAWSSGYTAGLFV